MARSGLSGAPEPVAQPTVSVITPFFNAERFLREAVDSVLAQTWPRWELILVDDGSADGSTDIAKAYARHHPGQIRYLEHAGHANRGMSASRNAGAAQARGSCLAFLDADDIFLPEKLARQVAFLGTHGPIEAVYGNSLWWCSWTGHAADASRDVLRQLRLPADATFEPGELTVRLVRRALRTPATCSVLVRRDAFAHIGGFEERFRAMYEDQAFFLKLFLHCRTHMAPGVLDWYRQHPESCCAVAAREGEFRADGGPSPSRGRFLDWAAEYTARHAPRQVRLRAAVELERWLQRHPRLVALAERASLRARRAWTSVRRRVAQAA